MARLARIRIYPLKSFDPVELPEARILPTGALEHDRQFALYDAEGEWVNGKRTPRVHAVRSQFDIAARQVSFQGDTQRESFHVDHDRERLERWLGEYFGLTVHLRENADNGFPDDPVAPGPTVIGTSTLESVANWFSGLSVEETRLRFRANLEIEGEEPFWEERLYSEEGSAVRFRIGTVELEGTNPCARCIVPTRSPTTGERYPSFGRIFEERRYETLPYWATRSRFDHFYRLAINTRPVSNAGGVIRVGDEVEVLE